MIYRYLIDPMLNASHARAASLVQPGEKVLDVACGNGTLAFIIAAKSGNTVTGIDFDPKKIKEAEQVTKKNRTGDLRFLLADATNLSGFTDKEFDVAVISMALHQFSPTEGLMVLKEMKRVAAKIIVADYAWPMHAGIYGLLARTIEWIAGGKHNRNFKQYMKNGGIASLLSKTGLHLKESYVHGKGTLMVSLCEILNQN